MTADETDRDTKRLRIIEAIRDPDDHRTRGAIARDFGIPASTVSRWASDEGLSFDPTQTALAIQAASLSVRDAQQKLAAKFLIRATEALDAMSEPTETTPSYVAATEFETGGWKSKELDQPPVADQRNLMVIAGIATQRATDLLSRGVSADVSDGVSLVGQLGEALSRFAAEAAPPVEEDPTVLP